jgi:rhamnosyltransferase
MQLVVGFVAYYPDVKWVERVEKVLQSGYTCWIFDNTPKGSPLIDCLKTYDTFKLCTTGENEGLGIAMNVLFQKVFQSGQRYILYFDQDSIFELETLVWIFEWVHQNRLRMESFAAVQFVSTQNTEDALDRNVIQRASLLINNACLFNLAVLEKMDWHDTRYFVEGVDYKFCLDSDFYGYALGRVFGAPLIDHETEQPHLQRRLANRVFNFRIYPWLRKKEFTKSLIDLSLTALKRRQFGYVYIFTRNIGTFWITQVAYHFLVMFGGKASTDSRGD